MRTRLLIAFLLIATITTTAISQPLIRDDSPDEKQEAELTPEESQEALEVAERFIKGFQETRDIGALIDEMFVSDYAERLQLHNLRHPFVLVHKDVPLIASPDELRSFFVALLNFWSLTLELYETSECHQKSDGCKDSKPEKVFPADALKFIKSDAQLAGFVSLFVGEKIGPEETTDKQDDSDVDTNEAEDTGGFFFKDTQELRSLTGALEKANALIRKHLLKLPIEKRALPSDSESADDEAIRSSLTILAEDDDFYGYPAGSQLICVNVLFFHLDLVRVDGRLKILAVSPLTD